MMTALLGAAGSATLLAISGNKASALEMELQEKVQEAQRLDWEMQAAKIKLDVCKDDHNNLVRITIKWRYLSTYQIMQEQMSNTIVAVCGLLSGLCEAVIVLYRRFTELNSVMEALIKEHTYTQKVVSDIQTNPEDAEM
jgi:hypothetical protein